MANYNTRSLDDLLRTPRTDEINEAVEELDEDLSFVMYRKDNKKGNK